MVVLSQPLPAGRKAGKIHREGSQIVQPVEVGANTLLLPCLGLHSHFSEGFVGRNSIWRIRAVPVLSPAWKNLASPPTLLLPSPVLPVVSGRPTGKFGILGMGTTAQDHGRWDKPIPDITESHGMVWVG